MFIDNIELTRIENDDYFIELKEPIKVKIEEEDGAVSVWLGFGVISLEIFQGTCFNFAMR